MTPEEILEGNKLITEFMGGVPYNNKTPEVMSNNGMIYHLSWEWLMEVVEKIWGITNCSDSIFRFTVGYKTYIMLENNTGKHIERCWRTCLAFVKWYNQNKEK